MSEIPGNQFRTKTGTCVITSEQILLERNGVRGMAASAIFGSSITRGLILYSVLAAVGLVIGVASFFTQDYFGAILFCGLGLVFGWNVWSSRHNSAASVIDRKAIRNIEAHPPRVPITRGYFVVHFDDKGVTRQRLIMLPGSMSNGSEEFERALCVMREVGLVPE